MLTPQEMWTLAKDNHSLLCKHARAAYAAVGRCVLCCEVDAKHTVVEIGYMPVDDEEFQRYPELRESFELYDPMDGFVVGIKTDEETQRGVFLVPFNKQQMDDTPPWES